MHEGLWDFRFFHDRVLFNACLNVLVSPPGDFAPEESSRSGQILKGLNGQNGKLSSEPDEQSKYSLSSRMSKNDRNLFLKEA